MDQFGSLDLETLRSKLDALMAENKMREEAFHNAGALLKQKEVKSGDNPVGEMRPIYRAPLDYHQHCLDLAIRIHEIESKTGLDTRVSQERISSFSRMVYLNAR